MTAATRGVLAIDVGSSSARAGVVDVHGEVFEAAAQRTYELERDREGKAQVDADTVVGLVADCVDEAVAELPESVELVAVALDTLWHSIGGVDADARPTTPVFTWSDRRADDDADALRDELDGQAVHARTGCVLHPSYVPAKLRWLARTQPETFERTARWLSPGEYALLRFCGEARIGRSMASGTGLLDVHTSEWDPEVLAAVGVDSERLSALSDAPLDGLAGEWAARWPRLAGIPWFPAVGDGACSNVGCGALGQDRAALMIGTSGAYRIAWRADDVEVPPGLWCYRVDGQRFLVGGALSNGGNLFAWLRRSLQLPDDDEAEAALARMAPGEHGLTFLPLLNGERSPGWADHARGTITGLSLATEPLHVVRAGLEAIALRFALIDGILDASVAGDHEVIGTGGGILRSPVWQQILADALGRPLTPSLVKEASARGAALLALEALGEIDAVEDMPAPLGPTVVPDPARHERYVEQLARQQELYRQTVTEPPAPAG